MKNKNLTYINIYTIMKNKNLTYIKMFINNETQKSNINKHLHDNEDKDLT